MIRGMFATFGMDQRSRDDYDTDACLEHSEEEVQQQFVDFYEDVLPEFRTAGKVVQFKVNMMFVLLDWKEWFNGNETYPLWGAMNQTSLSFCLCLQVSCNFEPHLRGNVYVQFDT